MPAPAASGLLITGRGAEPVEAVMVTVVEFVALQLSLTLCPFAIVFVLAEKIRLGGPELLCEETAASTTACVEAQKGTNEASEADPAAEKSFPASDPVPVSRSEFRCRAGGQRCYRETLRPRAYRAYNDKVSATVRDFQPEDFDTLCRIDQECFPPGISYSRIELRYYMRRSGSFTLIASDGSASTDGRDSTAIARASVPGHLSADVARAAICGFIVAEVGRRGVGHIITIDVVAAARRCGMGSLLLRAAEDRLRARGSFAVALETAVDNVSALRFYKRHGYDVIQTLPRYYSDGMDALVLQKELVAKPLVGAHRESSG